MVQDINKSNLERWNFLPIYPTVELLKTLMSTNVVTVKHDEKMITYSSEAQRPNQWLKLNSYVENEAHKRVTGLLQLQHAEIKGEVRCNMARDICLPHRGLNEGTCRLSALAVSLFSGLLRFLGDIETFDALSLTAIMLKGIWNTARRDDRSAGFATFIAGWLLVFVWRGLGYSIGYCRENVRIELAQGAAG